MQEGNVTNSLGVSSSSNSTSLETIRLRLAVNTTCQLKTVLDTLETAEGAVTTELEQEDGEDLEISVLQTTVKTLYNQSCEWVRLASFLCILALSNTMIHLLQLSL